MGKNRYIQITKPITVASRIDFTAIDTSGISEDRKKIIEIIGKVYASDNRMSLGRIIQNLNAPQLPSDQMDSSKMILNRIIHCQENNPTGDHIGNVKFSELLPLLQSKFARELEKRSQGALSFNEGVISATHSDYYIYYYESFDENKKEYKVRFALVGFDNDAEKNEWQTGHVYYFEDSAIHKIFKLDRIEPEKSNSNVLFFSARFDMQVNFFTIKVNNKGQQFRGLLPLTYSVTEGQSGFPCAGKGILERVSNRDYKKVILELLDERKSIKSNIINALHFNKLVSNELVFDKASDFFNPQTELLRDLAGVWTGVYLRPDLAEKHKSTSLEKGGICKFALYIKETGECQLFYAGADQFYTGFVVLPFKDKSLIKISLEFLKEEETYRMCAFLSAGSIGSSNLTYAGTISGWANINNIIYGSAIYMKQEHKVDKNISSSEVADIVKKIAPKRIPKSMRDSFVEIEKEFIDTLNQLEDIYLAKFNNCMPGFNDDPKTIFPHLEYIKNYSNRENKELKKLLSEALEESTDILAIGIANNRLTEDQTLDFYKSFLDRKGSARILFLDPKGKEIEKREIAEGWEKNSLSHAVNHAINNLKRFKEFAIKERPQMEDHIQWLSYDFQPTLNAIVVDKKIAFIHHYSLNNRGSDSPTIVIRKEEKDIFSFYLGEIEKTWDLLKDKTV